MCVCLCCLLGNLDTKRCRLWCGKSYTTKKLAVSETRPCTLQAGVTVLIS